MLLATRFVRAFSSTRPQARKLLFQRPSVAAAALNTKAPLDSRTLNGLVAAATRALDLLTLHAKHYESFNEVNLATCWSRLGRVKGQDRTWLQRDDGVELQALREHTESRVHTFGAQALSTTAHAMAKLDLRGAVWQTLWKKLEAAALERRSEFVPQNLANTAWAFATARHSAPALFDAIAAASAGRVGEFKPQELSNTAWAFATADHSAPALFDAIGAQAAGRVRELNPQDLANTAWAFATAGHAAPAIFDAIGKEAAGRVRELNPQNLANTAWAFATAGHAAPALFDAIGTESAGRVGEFKPQELSNTAWAFARAGHAAPALFDAIGMESAGKVHEFNPQNLANTAWAFAKAAHAAPALFNQQFTRRCDALADEFSVEHLCQLHQWHLWYAGEHTCSDGLPGAVLLARCEAAFRATKTKPL